MRLVLPALALLAVLSGAACAERPSDEQHVDSTALTPAPTPAGSPVEWQMTESGLGPLQAGLDLAAAAAVVPGTFTPSPAMPGSDCQYATWSDAPPGVAVMLIGGVVERVEVNEPSIATAEGARVGDAVARIDSLYAGRVRRTPHKYTDGSYLTVVAMPPADTLHRIVFETDGQRVTKYRAGRAPAVEYVEGCA